ncbi:MAG: hypothetical protein ACOYL6_10325 [Bacteriovoracaceae bacterium]
MPQFLLGFVLLTFTQIAFCQERSDAFLVKIFDNYVRVISPDKNYTLVSVIVENKTMSKMVGKIMKGKVDVTFLTIDTDKTKSVQVKYSKDEKLFFVPMAPAGQEIELIVGKKSYEIPPQK